MLTRLSAWLIRLGVALQPRETYRVRLRKYMVLAYRFVPHVLLERDLGWVVVDAVVLCAEQEPTEALIFETYREARQPEAPRAGGEDVEPYTARP